jgi:hypothetical protein
MSHSSDLLDKMTQILAYAGDEGAKDGYYLRSNNNGNPVYSVQIRSDPLESTELEEFVNKLKEFLENGTPLDNVPSDLIKKVNVLKAEFEKSKEDEKAELIQYLSDYEVDYRMHGGRIRKIKRTIKKRRKNRKSRKNARK